MVAVMLGWDPDRGSPWGAPYPDCVRRCQGSHHLLQHWPVGAWRLAPAGTRVHLMLLGAQRGLIGRGIVRTAPFLSADPARPGQVIHHVLIGWDTLLPLDRRIPVEALEAAVPELSWRSSYAGALTLTPDSGRQLDLIWAANAASGAQGRTANAPGVRRR